MEKKGNFLGLVPLIVFLVIYALIGIFVKQFDKLPLLVGIFIASAVAIAIYTKHGKKSFDNAVDEYCEGGGEKTLILMVIIYLLAGAFYSVANSMKAVDTVVALGLNILPSNAILPGLFLIACLLSFSMGTSMGTIAALMPIAVGISNSTGVNVAMLSGVVVGGAMFGDNLSFISDTTIAATRTQEIEMKDKFFVNIIMVLPAVILNVIFLAFQHVQANATNFTNINYVNLIPYILIIVLSLLGMNVMKVLAIGVISGLIIGVAHGNFPLVDVFTVIHTGMKWMEDMAIICVVVGGLVMIMNKLGGIDYLLYKLCKGTKSKKGAELSIALLVSLLDIATTNNTVSIVAAGPIAREISDKFDIDRRKTASILDLFSSAFNGLLPYAGQLLIAGAIAKVSPISIMPYNWYSILMIIFGLTSILLGWPNKKMKKE